MSYLFKIISTRANILRIYFTNFQQQDISPGATDTPMADNIKPSFTMLEEDLLQAEDVAKACISVLDTAPDVMVIIFINHYNMYEQNVEEKEEI